MPRVNSVKKARKEFTTTEDNVQIKKGDSYYYWEFRHGGKRTSKAYPKPQQLTRSGFWQSVYDIQDMISGLSADDGLPDAFEDIKSVVDDLKSEVESSLDNIPDQLRDSHMLNDRLSEMESWYDELDNLGFEIEEVSEEDVKGDIEGYDTMSEEDRKVAVEEAIANKREELWQEKIDEIPEYQGS